MVEINSLGNEGVLESELQFAEESREGCRG